MISIGVMRTAVGRECLRAAAVWVRGGTGWAASHDVVLARRLLAVPGWADFGRLNGGRAQHQQGFRLAQEPGIISLLIRPVFPLLAKGDSG